MAREIATYVPVINGKAVGHYRSFKNAFITFAAHAEASGPAVTHYIERRSTQAKTMTLDSEQAYAFAKRIGLCTDGKVNFAASEPSETIINDMFVAAADRVT